MLPTRAHIIVRANRRARSSNKIIFTLYGLCKTIRSKLTACRACEVRGFKVHGVRDRVNYNRGKRSLVINDRREMRNDSSIFAYTCAIKTMLGWIVVVVFSQGTWWFSRHGCFLVTGAGMLIHSLVLASFRRVHTRVQPLSIWAPALRSKLVS